MSKASLELGGGNWAAKDGNLLGYAVGDTSGKYLPREFTFSRGADIGATRVNKGGLIEKYRENLLTYSNQFDTTWFLNSASLTSGQAGYDGSNDAWELKATGDGVTNLARVSQGSLSVSGVSTFSVCVKAGNTDFVRINLLTSGTPNCNNYFDVANGSVGSSPSGSVLHSSITAAGNGFYRISITHDGSAGNINEVRIQVAEADGDEYPPTNSYVYIQDAQLERGLVATDYLESGSTTGKAGVLDNLPRIDYTGGSASLLLEPERDNWVTQSEHLESSSWYKARCTIEDNSTTSPEGVVNASKMTSTDASESYIGHNAAITGTKATWSFFAKKGDLDYAHGLVWDTSANGCRQWFNLSTGEVGGTTTFGSGHSVDYATIEDYGNGWYRCAMVVNLTAGTQEFRVNISSADTTITSPVNSYGYFYGLQAEDASYPTSYIPTYGTSVTRNADSCSKTGISSLIGQTEGTLFMEFNSPISAPPANQFLSFTDGTSTNRILFGPSTAGDTIRAVVIFSGVSNGGNNYSVTDITTNNKIALKYSSSSVDVFINGVKQASQSGGVFSNSISVITNVSGANSLYVNIKQKLVFPTALTDSECIALTTL